MSWASVAVVTAAVAVAFLPLADADFINFDDNLYVTENAHVKQGLTAAEFLWAWRATDAGNWHPLTWLSLELDRSLFGLTPRGFHLTNIALHWANSLLVLALAQRILKNVVAGTLVALLFAVHPLHVESVAWIAERKDVLSTFFGLLALRAYCVYRERPSIGRYLACAGWFVASLMAKPMLVTLPCLLLVFDWWPLNRADSSGGENASMSAVGWPRLLAEKLPLLAISAGSSLITVAVQRATGAVHGVEHLGLGERLANAVLGYGFYLHKSIVPTGLAIYYPLRDAPALLEAVAWAAGLALLTASAVWQRRTRPYLLFGWLWFLGTLVPVIGLVQTGFQAYADRYSYFPLIGLFIALGGLFAEALVLPVRKLAFATASMAVVVCVVLTTRQVAHWHDSESVWRQALRVTSDSAYAHYNLANAFTAHGKIEEALDELHESVRLDPTVDAHRIYGRLLARQRRYDEAIEQYRAAAELDADNADTHVGLANLLWLRGRFDEAEQELLLALTLDDSPDLRNKLVELQERKKRRQQGDAYRGEVEPHHTEADWKDGS